MMMLPTCVVRAETLIATTPAEALVFDGNAALVVTEQVKDVGPTSGNTVAPQLTSDEPVAVVTPLTVKPAGIASATVNTVPTGIPVEPKAPVKVVALLPKPIV